MLSQRNHRLIDLQNALLKHMTSPEFMFGDGDLETAYSDPMLRGFDIGHLRLEAESSMVKRFWKIETALPLTCRLLGPELVPLEKEFAAKNRPTTYERFVNVQEFYRFLRRYWQSEPTPDPFLPSIARYELAMAKVRQDQPSEVERQTLLAPPSTMTPVVRRHPCLELLAFDYDILSYMKRMRDHDGQTKIERPALIPMYIGITMQKRTAAIKVMTFLPEFYVVLSDLNDWITNQALSEKEHAIDNDMQKLMIDEGVLQSYVP